MSDLPHPADAFGDLVSAHAAPGILADLAAILASDREARVWHAVVTRHPEGDRVEARPLPDLGDLLEHLSGPLVVADTETTGLYPRLGDRITSVGIVSGRIADGAFREEGDAYERKVDPGRPSSAAALAVHGMADADLAGLPPFAAIAGDVAQRIDQAVVVAHNAPFDVEFLDLELASTPFVGVTLSAAAILDSRVVSKMLWPGEPGGLDALATRLGVDRGERDRVHGALADARLLARCLPGLAAEIERRLCPPAPSP
jgi:DNA polymerase III epsilon subunit